MRVRLSGWRLACSWGTLEATCTVGGSCAAVVISSKIKFNKSNYQLFFLSTILILFTGRTISLIFNNVSHIFKLKIHFFEVIQF